MLTCGIFFCTVSFAQTTTKDIKALSVGDQCPNFSFNNVINLSKNNLSLSDYSGKLLILDFWATWCGPCVSTMPHLDSLQKYFGDKIAVLQITNEDSTVVNNFRKTNPIIKNINLPSVTGRNQMEKYFPHYLIPHTIIIDEKGIVKAITSPEALTKAVIESMLAGKQTNVKQKRDNMNYDWTKPLLAGGLDTTFPIDVPVIKYYSLLTKEIEGLPGVTSGPEVHKDYSKIFCTNTYIQQLYLSAFATKNKPYIGANDPEFNMRFYSRIIWKAKDSTNFFGTSRKREDIKNIQLFSYELVAPKEDSTKLNQYMIEDLNRYFGRIYHIGARIVYKRVPCLVLTNKNNSKSWQSSGGEQEYVINADKKEIKVKNFSLNEFLMLWMNSSVPVISYPILNGTGYNGLVNITLNADPTNIESINKELAQYGLEFKEKIRKVKMILIEDVK